MVNRNNRKKVLKALLQRLGRQNIANKILKLRNCHALVHKRIVNPKLLRGLFHRSDMSLCIKLYNTIEK